MAEEKSRSSVSLPGGSSPAFNYHVMVRVRKGGPLIDLGADPAELTIAVLRTAARAANAAGVRVDPALREALVRIRRAEVEDLSKERGSENG